MRSPQNHIRTRSSRYAGALEIDPSWATEVVTDPDRLVDEPDPKSAHVISALLRQYLEENPDDWVNQQKLRRYCDECEKSKDSPLSPSATRPGGQRARVLSVRLNAGEFDELARYASALDVPASALARGWILDQLQAGSETPQRTVERLARDLEQLRRQIA